MIYDCKKNLRDLIDEIKKVSINMANSAKMQRLSIYALYDAYELSNKLHYINFNALMEQLDVCVVPEELNFGLSLLMSSIDLYKETYIKYGNEVEDMVKRDSGNLMEQCQDIMSYRTEKYESLIMLINKCEDLLFKAEEIIDENALMFGLKKTFSPFRGMSRGQIEDFIQNCKLDLEIMNKNKTQILIDISEQSCFYKIQQSNYSDIYDILMLLRDKVSARLLISRESPIEYISENKLMVLYDGISSLLFKQCSRDDWYKLWNRIPSPNKLEIKSGSKSKTYFLIRSLCECNLKNPSESNKEKWLTFVLKKLNIQRSDYERKNGRIDESDSYGNTENNVKFIQTLERVIKVKRNKRRNN